MSLFYHFGYQSILNVHIIVSGDFQRKSAKKRPLLFETLGTNTGLNMQNGPAVGRRLGVIDLYTLSIYIVYRNRNRKKVALLTFYCASTLRTK